MYKRGSQSQQYHSRTGSFSTRGTATGHVSVLPPTYDPLALQFLKPAEQLAQLRSNEATLAAELSQIDEQCAAARKRHQMQLFLSLDQKRQLLRNTHNGFRARIGHLETVLATARWTALEVSFYHLAHLMVDHSVFMKVEHQTRMLLGRERHEETVCAVGDWQDEEKHAFGREPEAVYAALQLRWERARARARKLHQMLAEVRKEMARVQQVAPDRHAALLTDYEHLGQQMQALGSLINTRRSMCKDWGEDIYCKHFRRIASDHFGPWICKQIEDAIVEFAG